MATVIDKEGKIVQLGDRALSDRFGGNLDFCPISVDEKLKQDGGPYLHISTLSDGHLSHQDPAGPAG